MEKLAGDSGSYKSILMVLQLTAAIVMRSEGEAKHYAGVALLCEEGGSDRCESAGAGVARSECQKMMLASFSTISLIRTCPTMH